MDGGQEYCREEGKKFKERIMGNCDAKTVVAKLERIYQEVMEE